MSGNYETCEPNADAMIISLRAFGYDLPMAISDLIDNSIFAKSMNIAVDYDWNSGKPWIRVVDDGTGMTENQLRKAMRLGSQSPLDKRDEEDLGRFGLGLKTASFSQCKLLTVHTKTVSGHTATRSWDIDHVQNSKKWELATNAPHCSRDLMTGLESLKSGTVVLWQKLDRIVGEDVTDDEDNQAMFLSNFQKVIQYLEMVFHRYLTGRNRIQIHVGRHECEPWDPFLTTNQFTQQLSKEWLYKYRIEITPFVLPHVSKRTREETKKGSGLYGWNAHQGFYIYRNKRMIIPGGYMDFDMTPEEHFKLCRIRLDLPNNLDHEWAIDVRKASASPPGHVRSDLERVAKAARAQAVRIYRARTGETKNVKHRGVEHDVWLKKRRGDKILYRINGDNEVVKKILSEINPSKSWVRKLFHMIETTVPHRLIIMDNAEQEDCHVDLPIDVAKPPTELLKLCEELFLEAVEAGRTPSEAIDYVCASFDDHIDYRIMLEELVEKMQ